MSAVAAANDPVGRSAPPAKRARKPERIMLMVKKGMLVPADQFAAKRLRDRGYHVGDVVSAELKKPRNPKFHRLVHVFGQMVADNIEDFHGMAAHVVLKRLQIEANIACDEMFVRLPGIGGCSIRQAQSLSFESMDEAVFSQTFQSFCRHVAERYWPTLTEGQVKDMAELACNQEAA